LASVVVSTYNRANALSATLAALAHQNVPASEYEVLVVDDGSTDATQEVLAELEPPYALRTFRLNSNRGVSAGRNVGLANAQGRYVILLSDDLLVPPDFISAHVETLKLFVDAWVVGGSRQLDAVARTPFGRFLEALEQRFERERVGVAIGDGLYEMSIPTARNLSFPRTDLDRVGLFDERFRVACEDQDLAQRAAERGIRFIYNTALDCLHNDQAADLPRYCRFQERGAADTARLCAKYPELHGDAPIAYVNGPARRSDGLRLLAQKITKSLLKNAAAIGIIAHAVDVAERAGLPEAWVRRGYQTLISIHTFRGFRAGLSQLSGSPNS
jgi:glycosyltransferase involved in cell wall biosynthesis